MSDDRVSIVSLNFPVIKRIFAFNHRKSLFEGFSLTLFPILIELPRKVAAPSFVWLVLNLDLAYSRHSLI